jgi:outer membrane protein W
MMKTILVLSLMLMCMVQHLAAQSFEKGIAIISCGQGFPYFPNRYFNSYNNERYTNYKESGTGPLHAKLEYALSKKLGLALCMNHVYSKTTFNDTSRAYLGSHKATALNLRTNYHFLNSKKFDPYIGVGIGWGEYETVWPIVPPFTVPNHYSFEASLGVRAYVLPKWAFYGELGFTTSIAQLGLSYRFAKSRDKK